MNKKNFHKKLTALVLGGLMAFSASSALAADTVQLDLEDAVRIALENNRTLKQSYVTIVKEVICSICQYSFH